MVVADPPQIRRREDLCSRIVPTPSRLVISFRLPKEPDFAAEGSNQRMVSHVTKVGLYQIPLCRYVYSDAAIFLPRPNQKSHALFLPHSANTGYVEICCTGFVI